ncbi:hypothetical protein [Helicobacter rodentium]|uniref:hypothetical protein n=2 Tax=Helicobacter rodentium TaxID=59617 RepID=UPI0023F47A99|nr:hypothetical protein [Helicobacter rodentium]
MFSVYIDNSGSMNEMDKISVVKYVAYAIPNATFYLLNGEQIKLDSITLNNDNNLCIEAEGRKILLSDGLFNCDEKIFDIALAIGLDADVESLKKVANKVYILNDVVAFLESIHSNLSTHNEDSLWE